MAGFKSESGAVGGTNQGSVVNQELAGRIVKAPSGMRAFVVKRRNGFPATHEDQIEAAGAGVYVHGDGAARGNFREPA